MTKEDFKNRVLTLAYEANKAAFNKPAARVVSDVFSTLYSVLDHESYERIDQVLRKSFPKYYQEDGRTTINMDHYKKQGIQGGYVITKKTEAEIAAMYAPSSIT